MYAAGSCEFLSCSRLVLGKSKETPKRTGKLEEMKAVPEKTWHYRYSQGDTLCSSLFFILFLEEEEHVKKFMYVQREASIPLDYGEDERKTKAVSGLPGASRALLLVLQVSLLFLEKAGKRKHECVVCDSRKDHQGISGTD
jgi:hypothetical protein